MRRDEIRDQVLLFARQLGVMIKQLFKPIVAAHARLHHFRQWAFLGVFRSNLQITAHVMGSQFFDIARIFYRQIVTYS